MNRLVQINSLVHDTALYDLRFLSLSTLATSYRLNSLSDNVVSVFCNRLRRSMSIRTRPKGGNDARALAIGATKSPRDLSLQKLRECSLSG